MAKPTCTVPDCEKPLRSSGTAYCAMHYHRLYRHGSLEPLRPKRERRGICTVVGCNLVDQGADGLCTMHHTRARRHGSPDIVNAPEVRYEAANPAWTGDGATYNAVHIRVRSERGPARSHVCADCPAPARHWSYDHNDPDEKTSERGPYSLDLSRYQPRCVSCHKHFDLDRGSKNADHR